jgi:hypothetical protein
LFKDSFNIQGKAEMFNGYPGYLPILGLLSLANF